MMTGPSQRRSARRVELINEIERLRNSSVIVYFLGDRHPTGAQLAEDAIRPLFDHLVASETRCKETGKVELFIYGRGGRVEVPWRIVSMFREFAEEFNVLVPYKAYSAVTLVALGADHILMGKKGELSPIDPSLERTRVEKEVPVHEEIPVEDIMSYITFVKEKVGVSDQASLATSLQPLADQLTALTLGNVQRASSHIRIVARKLLESRKEPLGEQKVAAIIDTLVEKIYFHGHGIGRREAGALGLPVQIPEPSQEKVLWQLYEEYEELLQLRSPIDPRIVFPDDRSDEHMVRGNCAGAVESTSLTHLFLEDLQFLRVRDVPQLTLNVNLPIQLPPGLQPGAIPPGTIQQILQQLLPQIQQQVREALVTQSRVRGVTLNRLGGRWTMIE